MKKLFALMMILSVLLIAACGKEEGEAKASTNNNKAATTNQSKNTDAPKESTEKKEQGLHDIVDYFKSKGYEVGKTTQKDFTMINATDGFGIDIDGQQLEFYQLDPSNADAKKNLDDAKAKGNIDMQGFTIPAVVNGNYLMLRFDDHKEKDKVIETFKSFK